MPPSKQPQAFDGFSLGSDEGPSLCSPPSPFTWPKPGPSFFSWLLTPAYPPPLFHLPHYYSSPSPLIFSPAHPSTKLSKLYCYFSFSTSHPPSSPSVPTLLPFMPGDTFSGSLPCGTTELRLIPSVAGPTPSPNSFFSPFPSLSLAWPFFAGFPLFSPHRSQKEKIGSVLTSFSSPSLPCPTQFLLDGLIKRPKQFRPIDCKSLLTMILHLN